MKPTIFAIDSYQRKLFVVVKKTRIVYIQLKIIFFNDNYNFAATTI